MIRHHAGKTLHKGMQDRSDGGSWHKRAILFRGHVESAWGRIGMHRALLDLPAKHGGCSQGAGRCTDHREQCIRVHEVHRKHRDSGVQSLSVHWQEDFCIRFSANRPDKGTFANNAQFLGNWTMDCAYDPTTGVIRDIPLFKAHLSLDAEPWAPEKGMGGIVTHVCSLYPCTEPIQWTVVRAQVSYTCTSKCFWSPENGLVLPIKFPLIQSS